MPEKMLPCFLLKTRGCSLRQYHAGCRELVKVGASASTGSLALLDEGTNIKHDWPLN
jgi:hypothetical protein